jgi:hypothetical protein
MSNSFETTAVIDLEITQGADFIFPLTYLDDNEAPIVLTGHTFTAAAFRSPLDVSPLFSFTVTIENAAQGEFKLSVSAATTNAIVMLAPQEILFWALNDTLAGVITPVMRGRIVLVASPL